MSTTSDATASRARTYEVRTYGCQMNAHDSERISGLLEGAGYVRAGSGQDADVVVCSGGMSVYEIAALGTPGLVLAQNAREDQRMREFARNGTVEYLGLGTEVSEQRLRDAVMALLADAGRRQAMSAKGRALVDGLGAARTAELVLENEKRREAALSREGR